MRLLLLILLLPLRLLAQPFTVSDPGASAAWIPQDWQQDYISWNYDTNYAGLQLVSPQQMSFGGPGIWDPAAGLWRAYFHDVNDNKIYMVTSTNGYHFANRTLALDVGPAGSFDSLAVGVPFTWYEAGEIRPWRMLHRGEATGTVYAIGLATSLDGITWDRKDTAGNSLTNYVLNKAVEIDFGNCMKHQGSYYLYYNGISSPREIYLATSTDLVNWTKYNSETALFKGVQTIGGTWDYDDATHSSSSANAAFGWFCPWVGQWHKTDGTIQFVAYAATYYIANEYPSVAVFTCPDPYFASTNRTFLGFVFNPSTTTHVVNGHTITKSDVPRLYCDTIAQNPVTSSLLGGNWQLWVSVLTSDGWEELRMSRTGGLPLPCENLTTTGASLSNCAYLFPGNNPTIQLSYAPTANTVYQFSPALQSSFHDVSGYDFNVINVGQVDYDALGALLPGSASRYLQRNWDAAGSTPQFTNVTKDFTIEYSASKANVIGAAAYRALVHFYGPAGDNHLCYIYLNGSAGDTAVAWTIALKDTGGATRTFTTATFDWSTGARTSWAFSVSGGKIYWFKDGILQNAGGTAFNYSIKAYDPIGLRIGLNQLSSFYWDGYIDEMRYSSAGRYTSDYVVGAFTLGYQTNGYVFSRVYDMNREATPILASLGTTPTGCAVAISHRLAANATDKSVTAGDFAAGTSRGRYHQWMLTLTGPGTATPTITGLRVRSL